MNHPNRRAPYGKVGTVATCLAAGLALSGCGYHPVEKGELVTETESIDRDDAELTRVEFKMGTGKLDVRGGAADLMDATFRYDVPLWKPEVEYSSTGSRSDIRVEQPRTSGAPFGHYEYQWDIALSDETRMDVVARMGAGEAHMNLSTMQLRNVEVEIGVGEVELNLDGRPEHSYDVQINGGVGQATVYLPDDVAISATAEGALGDIKVEGLQQRGRRYINPGHEDDPVMIRVDVRGGIGEIRLITR